MQSDRDEYDIGGGYPFDPNGVPGYAGYAYGGPGAPAFDASLAMPEQHQFPVPLNNVEFQPSETCPKNYVIFDQTYSKSRVMFHPSFAHKFGSSSFNMYDTHGSEAGRSSYRDNNNDNDEEEIEDIDALLSSEDGYGDDDDDDVISTGRTPGKSSKWGGTSPDTACSSGKLMPNSDKRASGGERKRDRMKKMVKTLKGIVPGGERMDTPAVLDEAVKYLKSLKVQAFLALTIVSGGSCMLCRPQQQHQMPFWLHDHRHGLGALLKRGFGLKERQQSSNRRNVNGRYIFFLGNGGPLDFASERGLGCVPTVCFSYSGISLYFTFFPFDEDNKVVVLPCVMTLFCICHSLCCPS